MLKLLTITGMTNKELQIVRESLELFHLYGIRSLNLEDISRLVKLPLRVLKRYFPTKECLLQKCVKYRISQEEIFKYTDDSLLDILIRFSEAFLPLYRKISHRCCMRLFFNFCTGIWTIMRSSVRIKHRMELSPGISGSLLPRSRYMLFSGNSYPGFWW